MVSLHPAPARSPLIPQRCLPTRNTADFLLLKGGSHCHGHQVPNSFSSQAPHSPLQSRGGGRGDRCCERKVPRARIRSARACRLSHCAEVEERGSTLVLFSCTEASPRCLPLLYPLGRGRSPRHPPSQRPLAVPHPRRAPPPGSPRRLVQAGLPHTQRPPRVGAAAG